MNNRLIAIGDIHGCFDQFVSLTENVLAIRKSDKIILLGDYIDRGPKIREVVDYILDLRLHGFNIVTLTGNHEFMLLDSVKGEKYLSVWFMNGGFDTLSSFGAGSVTDMEEKYMDFFRNLPFYYLQDDFIFVHAGFNDDLPDPFSDTTQMIWSRRESYSNPKFDGKTIIHGHTPVPISYCRELVESGSRIINIDTGCVYGRTGGYGYLTAIELNSRELFSV